MGRTGRGVMASVRSAWIAPGAIALALTITTLATRGASTPGIAAAAPSAATEGSARPSAPAPRDPVAALLLGCACDDGNACTIDDCDDSGACTHGDLVCNDQNGCTYDGCDPYYGCYYTPVNVSDGSVCTIDTCDPETGGAIFTPIDCNDRNTCTEDGCDPITGCTHGAIHEGASCGDPCIPDGVCSQGICIGALVDCNDGNPCTSDSCESPSGQALCVHPNDRNTACDDLDVCTTHDICWSGACAGGQPTFEPAPSPAVGEHPLSAVTGDFNHDNRPDIVVVNQYSHNVTVLLGNGAGGFLESPGSPVATALYPERAAVADFNRDLKPDLAVTSQFDKVNILLGDGLGGFAEAPGAPIVIAGRPSFVAAGDLDRDGTVDLAVSNVDPGRIAILLGDGAGGFTPATSSPVNAGPSPYFLSIADFNGDAKLDIAATNTVNPGTVTLLLGDGAGGFAPSAGSPFPVGIYPLSIAAGDFDGDGTRDLAVASEYSGSFTVLLGDGTGGFSEAAGSPVDVRYPRSIAALDFDLDGDLDLAVANGSFYGETTVLRGDGTGRFEEAAGSPVGVGAQPNDIAVADFNLDGRPDMALANFASGNASILLDTTHVAPSGTACSDSNPCTLNDACAAGACVAGAPDACDDGNPCTDDSCDPASGCAHTPNAAPCDDGDTCTGSDTCSGGACAGGPAVPCDDGNLCTDDSCDPASGCVHTCNNDCNVKGTGYWRKLCRDRDHPSDHSGDFYTDLDVACVSASCTFADVATVDQMCARLDPSHGGNDRCSRAEAGLLSLLLNLCRCRLQPSQPIDAHCDPPVPTVAEAAARADAALCDPGRTEDACRHPECSTIEITNGAALWQNTLRIQKEGQAVRLSWSAVYGDPTLQAPRKYRIWRRQQDTGPYTMLGEVNDHTFTFLDAAAPGNRYEYEVTATN